MPGGISNQADPKYIKNDWKIGNDKMLYTSFYDEMNLKVARPLGTILQINYSGKYTVKSGDQPIPVFFITVKDFDNPILTNVYVLQESKFYVGSSTSRFTPIATKDEVRQKVKDPKMKKNGAWLKSFLKNLVDIDPADASSRIQPSMHNSFTSSPSNQSSSSSSSYVASGGGVPVQPPTTEQESQCLDTDGFSGAPPVAPAGQVMYNATTLTDADVYNPDVEPQVETGPVTVARNLVDTGNL